ncbi:nose resistant to fluoxetine protein 6-like [Wyeomyia smithii]|uniref:nose resistant to fluoxetine protein 6-like n=1 Tax=Wyeomyia smithii TaxID=174621 RepID=UPI002467FE87|nr:nose resistant to fluoxetine protein 6-like [Wyeomyia smithii]
MAGNLRMLLSYLLLLNGCSVLGSLAGPDKYGYIAPLFEYDNYSACRRQQPALYCIAKVVIEPVPEVYNSSRIIASPRKNVLERGVCVNQCVSEVAALNESEQQRLFQPKVNVSYMYTMSIFWQAEVEHHIHQYGNIVNICINNRLEQKHNIVAYSELEYCIDDKAAANADLDWAKIAFATVLLALLVTFLITNVMDLLGNDQLRNQNIVSSFSIRRNLVQFLREPKTEIARDFAYIDGLRVLICSCVLLSHCLLSAKFTPISNPETFVQLYYNPITLIIVTPLAMLVKIFFTISGLLLTVNVLKDYKTKPQTIGWYYFCTKFVHRLIRLLPVYYFFLLHTTVYDWFPGVDVGIIGYKTLTMERLLCRQYWWSNALFLNNLPIMVGQCFGHTWYIGTDVQLFAGGLLILALCIKWPAAAKPLLSAMLVISALFVSSMVNYGGIEPVFVDRFSDAQFMYMKTRYFREMYQPSYTNMGCTVAGIMIGFLYHNIKNNGLDLKSSQVYKIIKWISVPISIATVVIAPIFYEYEVNLDSPWVPFYSIFYVYFSVILTSVWIVDGFQEPQSSVRRFLGSRSMAAVGKLSYCAYLLHPTLMRIFSLSPLMPDLPVEFTVGSLFGTWLGVTIGSYLVGAVFYFCLEQPMSLLLRTLYVQYCSQKKKL